jgi:hypothetical protein
VETTRYPENYVSILLLVLSQSWPELASGFEGVCCSQARHHTRLGKFREIDFVPRVLYSRDVANVLVLTVKDHNALNAVYELE